MSFTYKSDALHSKVNIFLVVIPLLIVAAYSAAQHMIFVNHKLDPYFHKVYDSLRCTVDVVDTLTATNAHLFGINIATISSKASKHSTFVLRVILRPKLKS